MKKKTLLSWSSGKDSAWALNVLRQNAGVELVGLLSVINERANRVSMHATRMELLRRQAKAVGTALHTILLPDPCTDAQYRAAMGRFVAESAARKIACIAFGDLFLEDVRQYRENQLKGTGIDPLFPLWHTTTRELADRMLASGVEAYVSCVDLKKLPAEMVGLRWTRDFLSRLPAEVDLCGENGEFHTIVVNGPMFEHRIEIEIGDVVHREGFAYADIIPV
ncbi:MAG: hypothetical protein R6U50_05470 [Desulfobacterales bacterium]